MLFCVISVVGIALMGFSVIGVSVIGVGVVIGIWALLDLRGLDCALLLRFGGCPENDFFIC
jgi:hypothetical protein